MAVARRSAAVTLAGLTVGIGLLLDRVTGMCPGHTCFAHADRAPLVDQCSSAPGSAFL